MEKLNSQLEHGNPMDRSKQEACFAHATGVWLAVNHITCITSRE